MLIRHDSAKKRNVQQYNSSGKEDKEAQLAWTSRQSTALLWEKVPIILCELTAPESINFIIRNRLLHHANHTYVCDIVSLIIDHLFLKVHLHILQLRSYALLLLIGLYNNAMQ